MFRKLDRAAWLGGWLMVAAGLWAFWPALQGGPLWDDDTELFRNPALHSGAGLWAIWTGSTGPDYFPLKGTVEWIQWHCWHDHVLGYHATSLACHLASALLFWGILNRLFGRRTWAAWLGALLFALHPAVTESVAWMAELKNTLSLVFLLFSARAFLTAEPPAHAERASLRASLAWFAAALLSKTSVVMFPWTLLLYRWWRNGRLSRKDGIDAAPFFLLSAVLGAVTICFQSHRAIADLPLHLGGPAARIAAALHALWDYWLLSFVPFSHQPIYPLFRIPGDLFWVSVGSGALVMIAIAAWTHPTWRRGIVLALGWFLLNLVPVLGFIPMSYLRIAPVADHFLYLSILGLIGLGAAALEFIPRERVTRAATAIAFAAYLIVAAGNTHRYASAFRDDEGYWRWALAWDNPSWLARNNLGSALLKRNDPSDALTPLWDAHKLNPDAAEVTANLSAALLQTGAVAAAVSAGEAAVRAEPDFATGHYNLANALAAAGRKLDAVGQYRTATRLEPGSVEFHYNLANALAETGNLPEAAAALSAAARIEPGNFAVQFNLGNVLAAQDRLSDAVTAFRAAVQIDPESADAHYCLGDALAATQAAREAAREYQAALRIRPGDPAIIAALRRVSGR